MNTQCGADKCPNISKFVYYYNYKIITAPVPRDQWYVYCCEEHKNSYDNLSEVLITEDSKYNRYINTYFKVSDIRCEVMHYPNQNQEIDITIEVFLFILNRIK